MGQHRPLPGRVVVSVGDSGELREVTLLEIAARQMILVYEKLVNSGTWDARFLRGRRRRCGSDKPNMVQSGKIGAAEAVRSLASVHLSSSSTDGWDVVAGAIELARVWALVDRNSCAPRDGYSMRSELYLETRMRLSVCLSVSWKFQRSLQTVMYRDFESSDGAGIDSTLELAFVAYAFLNKEEQEMYGPWDASNTDSMRELQLTALHLEIELVCGSQTLGPMTANPQSVAETHIHALFEQGVLSSVHCMQMRSVVPFFWNASLYKRRKETESLYEEIIDNPHAGAGLVCAAWTCIQCCGTIDLDLYLDKSHLFGTTENAVAWRFIDTAARACFADSTFYRRGCYQDTSWYGHGYLARETLIAAAHVCATQMDCHPSLFKLSCTSQNEAPSPIVRVFSRVCPMC